MPIVFDTSPLLRPPFTAGDFTATKWEPAEGKAQFANNLCRFIAADFKQSLFTQKLYHRLALTFGHIAHCNRPGYFDHFFRNLRGKVEFLEETLIWRPPLDPTCTWCDVQREVQKRLGACNLLAAYRALRDAERKGAERELLRRLQNHQEQGGEVSSTLILHPGRPARQARKPALATQSTLF